MRWMMFAAGTLGLVVSGASGQSINLDAGDGAGAPPPTYGAAGLSGTWNVLTVGPGVPMPLVDLVGRPTAASVTYDVSTLLALDDPGTSGEVEALLDDGIVGLGDVVVPVMIEGLRDGCYEVIVYGWTPQAPTDSTIVVVEGEIIVGQITGGPWPGELEQGVTHLVVNVEVAGGTLNIEFAGGVFGHQGFLNGVQLRRVTAADLDGDGRVTITDLLALLAAWGPCPAPCGADLDGDGLVGILDLLAMLAEWD